MTGSRPALRPRLRAPLYNLPLGPTALGAFLARPKADRSAPRRPSKAELAAAVGGTVKDVIRPRLHVLFAGINPGLYSAAVGHHFAGPSNRFWPVLHAAGLTPRRLYSYEEPDLLALGYGITNIVSRATAAAAELTEPELVRGARVLESKVRRYHPRVLAVLGVTAFRAAFRRRHATFGRQPETIGDTAVWVLPNPSGLNAHFTPTTLAPLFRAVRDAARRQ
jgi:double-stranded uracil-DNA glycosylase